MEEKKLAKAKKPASEKKATTKAAKPVAKPAATKKTITVKDLNKKADKVKKSSTAKKAPAEKLSKYYISEKVDRKANEVTFSFKKANVKVSRKFDDFLEAVNEFIRVAESSTGKSRVWFHRDGAYRGSVDITKAKIIVERLTTTKIEKAKVIEYIETENLVDKTEPKVVKKVIEEPKVEVTPVVTQEVDLNKEALKAQLSVEQADAKYTKDIKASEVITSLSGYEVIVEKVVPNKDELEIYYYIQKGDARSATTIRTLKGFKKDAVVVLKPEIIEVTQPILVTTTLPEEEIKSQEATKSEVTVEEKKEEGTVTKKAVDPLWWFWLLIAIFAVILVINIVLLSLTVAGKL
ncbi:hypothetical protein JN00_0317 [Metamycoplasma subdolum]|uniref:Uncharacterized protein n=2 Tax=Metamycoplasma subdolum TaxID=92407 RepID=A0A3M0A1I6_9BACT|nr:hypothetical protein JN00_0317 [Metamycoplasma subdolum]